MTWSIEHFMGIPPFLDTAIYLQTSPCKLQKPQRGSAGFSTVAPRFQSSNSCSWRQLLMTRPEVCLEIVDRTWCVSCDRLGCFRPSLFDGRFVLGTACGTQGTWELWHHRMYQWKSCGRRMLSKIILDNVAYHPAKGCSIPYPHSCWLNPLFWWKCLSGLSEHEDRVTASESNGKRSSSAACYMKSWRRLRWIEMVCLKMMYTYVYKFPVNRCSEESDDIF